MIKHEILFSQTDVKYAKTEALLSLKYSATTSFFFLIAKNKKHVTGNEKTLDGLKQFAETFQNAYNLLFQPQAKCNENCTKFTYM